MAAGLAVTAVSACGGSSKASGGVLGDNQTAVSTGAAPTTAGSSSDATGTVTKAISKVSDSSGVQLVITLAGKASAFPTSGTATPAQLQAILNSQLIIATHTSNGGTLASSAKGGSSGDFQIALVNAGANLGTFEIIGGKTLYARVDINKTSTVYGLGKGSAEKAQQELQQASAEIPGLDALEAGSWVSIDLTPLLQLEKQSASTSNTIAGLNPASEQKLVSQFIQAFKQNSQITKVGSANGGTEYQAVVREKALVNALGQAAQSIPGLGSKAGKLNGANIPATQTATVDMTIKNGSLTELSLPLNQFDTNHKLRGPLTLNMGISPSGAISVPADAKAINLAPILSELGSTKT
jgi:hypothetical protein